MTPGLNSNRDWIPSLPQDGLAWAAKPRAKHSVCPLSFLLSAERLRTPPPIFFTGIRLTHSESSETFEAFRVEHWTRFLHRRERNPHQLRRFAFRIKKQRIRRYARRIHPMYVSPLGLSSRAQRGICFCVLMEKSGFLSPKPGAGNGTS